MKTSRLYFIILSILLSGILLSACAGGAGVATSWPGLSVDGETGYLAFNNHVYAINLTTGTEIWRFPLETDNQINFYASPASGNEQLLAGGYNNILYSLNPADGATNWTFTGATNRYVASPLATEQSIYAPSADGRLYVLDYNGNLRWEPFRSEHALWATPVTDGNLVFQPAMDHFIYAFDAQDGKLVWQTEDLGGALVGNPTLGEDGVLYVGTFARELLALDTQSGAVLYRYSTEGWVWSGPALEGDRLYFGDLDGYVYALNAADLGEVWKIQPDTLPKQAISDKPLAVEDTVYVSSESGNLYAIDTANGNIRWPKTIGGRLHASPVLAGDTILVTPLGIESALVALDLNGNQKWTFTPQ